MRKPLLFPLLFLCLISSVSSVHAAEGDDVNFMEFPQQLAERIGIPVFAAQLLISSVFLFAFLLPCAIWGKTVLPTIIIGFSIMGFLIAVSWLPYWFLLVIALLIALMFASRMKAWITGGEN